MSLLSATRRAVGLMVLLGTLAATCGDPASPNEDITRDIEITNVFAGTSGATLSRANFATVSITRVRLSVYASPSGTTLFQETFDVDPAQSKWTLSFTAPVGETVRIIAELISVTGGQEKVEYSGQAGPLTLEECTTNCAPIPVQTYPGPVENLAITSVTVSPDGPGVVAGQTTTLTASAAPSGPTYTFAWSSLDPEVATVDETGVVTGVASGTARIRAAAGTKADTVNVTVTAANTCVETPYTIGSTANGAWADGDCLAASGSGRRFDMYAVTLAQQTSFTVQLTGPAGRRINVRRAGTQDYVQVMAGEAAMPAAQNPLTIGYILPAGSYVMEVANPDAATLGNYTLATTTTLPAGCSSLVYTWPGVTINGSIASTDCARPGDAGREDRYIVLPDAGVRLKMEMTSTAFPVSLNFLDVQTEIIMLAYDRQFELGEPAIVEYTTTFAGFHNVAVTHNTASSTGNYTLTIGTASATNTCSAIDTDYGERMAKWESTDCAADGYVYDKFTFTTDEQTALKVSLASAAANKTAGVFQNGVEVVDWAGAGTGNLNAAWLLVPGTYEVRLGIPAASAGASYTYVATEPTDIECTNNATMSGVTFSGVTLGGSDCTFDGRFEDRVIILVGAGKTIDVTMDGTTVAPGLAIRDPGATPGVILVGNTRSTTGTITASYTTTVAGYYQIIFSTHNQGATGTYGGSIVVR